MSIPDAVEAQMQSQKHVGFHSLYCTPEIDVAAWSALARSVFGAKLVIAGPDLPPADDEAPLLVLFTWDAPPWLLPLLRKNEQRAQPRPVIVVAQVANASMLPGALRESFSTMIEVSR